MERVNFTRVKIIATISVAIWIVCLLLWEHFNGGVPSHRILQREDLPKISNWWGALLLPVLAWVTVNNIKNRHNATKTNKSLGLFISGFVTGLTIAISFANNVTPILENVPYVLLLLSLIIPIFYSEFILGFVLAMTYTFGAILPTAFVLVFSGLGFLFFKLRRFVSRKLIR